VAPPNRKPLIIPLVFALRGLFTSYLPKEARKARAFSHAPWSNKSSCVPGNSSIRFGSLAAR
jgi:hypothetical protein